MLARNGIRRGISILFFLLLFAGIVRSQETGTGKIVGKLMIKGDGPMAGGLVHFFDVAKGPVPDPDRYWRVPEYVAEVNNKGEFDIMLPEGRYYIGGVKRVSGKREIGPPGPGDFFYKGFDEHGVQRVLVVKKDKSLDLGTISEAVPFEGVTPKDKVTGIEGRIVFDDGTSAEGALVFAYITQNVEGRPSFVSDRTGKNGKYLLRVRDSRKYYLKVRDIYGGGPLTAGGIIGGYGGDVAEPVSVKAGEVTKGIDMTVTKFKGRGPQSE